MSPHVPHQHTIATVSIGPRTYEIDWPNDPEDETIRDVWVCAIFQGDGMIAVVEPDGLAPGVVAEFTTAQQVVDAGLAWLEENRNPNAEPLHWSWCHNIQPDDGIGSLPEEDPQPGVDTQWMSDGEAAELIRHVTKRTSGGLS